jgi:uncharacterized protein (DUF1697 family)
VTAPTRRSRATTFVALLRGINLGAHNKISMSELRALVAEHDVENVQTYVQSGNVVFRSRVGRAQLVRALETGIRRELGLDVSVLLRTKAELAKVVASNPFAERQDDPLKLHVTFLTDRVPAARARDLDPERSPPDEFQLEGREIYVHTPQGYGRTKLTNAYFERRLGVAATSRNWRTVTKLVELTST